MSNYNIDFKLQLLNIHINYVTMNYFSSTMSRRSFQNSHLSSIVTLMVANHSGTPHKSKLLSGSLSSLQYVGPNILSTRLILWSEPHPDTHCVSNCQDGATQQQHIHKQQCMQTVTKSFSTNKQLYRIQKRFRKHYVSWLNASNAIHQ